MDRRPNLALILVAAGFFALGFIVADRMSTAISLPANQASDQGGGAFSGTEGTLLIRGTRGPSVLIIRGSKMYRVDPEAPAGTNNKVWGSLDAF
jgi:hypothetical protein